MDISGFSNYSYDLQANAYSQAKTDLIGHTLKNAASGSDDAELLNACREFESYFISVMFKEMRKTVDTSNSVIPNGNAEDIFQSLLDEQISKSAATSGGIGLADFMFRQMKREQGGTQLV